VRLRAWALVGLGALFLASACDAPKKKRKRSSDDDEPASVSPPSSASVIVSATVSASAPVDAGAPPIAVDDAGPPDDDDAGPSRVFRAPPKVDPRSMKEYRVEICVYGTRLLEHARDAYQASLPSGEPGPGRIPSFGIAPQKDPLAPHHHPSWERHARACRVAQTLKEPAMPAVDAALAAFEPVANQIAKDLAMAEAYYRRGDHQTDSFAIGKELHVKLVRSFKLLSKLRRDVETAYLAEIAAHPHDLAGASDGHRVGWLVVEQARRAMAAAMAGDAAKLRAASSDVDKGVAALGKLEERDPYRKIIGPVLEKLVKALADVRAKKSRDDGELVAAFVLVVEARHRAISRELIQTSR
jgi:hypothetical protein